MPEDRPEAPTPSDAPDDDLRPAYRRVYEIARDAAKQVLRRRFRLVHLARTAYRKTLDEEDAVRAVKGDLLTLVRLVRAWTAGDYRQVSPKTLLSVVGAVLYFVSPLDAVPDFLPVVGYADDVAVIAAVVRAVHADLDAFRAWEAKQQHDPLPGGEKSSGPNVAPNNATPSGDGAPPHLSS